MDLTMKIKTSQEISQEYNVTTDGMTAKKWVAVDDLKKDVKRMIEEIKSLSNESKDREITQELIDKFDDLCEKYSCEDIDVKMLKNGVNDVIDNWSS